MQLKNTKENFGFVAKFFHWAVAILILLLLNVGFWMGSLEMSPFKINIYMLHKSFGLLVLLLVIGRISWRYLSPRPDPLPTHKHWEDTLAKAVHFGLYLCMVFMPLSGLVMSWAGGFPVAFFGIPLASPIPKTPLLLEIMQGAHTVIAYLILFFLALHFGGAFKHHFIDKDETLKRMTSPKVGLWWGLLLLAVAGFLWTRPILMEIGEDEDEAVQTAPVQADETAGSEAQQNTPPVTAEGWQIDLQNSSIQFEATQYGERFGGKFTNFGGKIIFDPAKLDDAYADIWIDITSIDTGSADRDSQAKSGDWFDTANFPKAQFVADSFSETSPGHYVAHGALTIRGKAAMVDLPFTLQVRESPEGQAALMEGQADLNRLDFGIGQGQWQATDTIGDAVRINITLLATQ